MKLNKKGKKMIRDFEGFRSSPYLDSAGVPTIGYGFTFYPDTGRRVTLNDPPISRFEANKIFDDMVKPFESAVNSNVKSKLNQNQFNALTSFTYNLGEANLKRSTLLRKVNQDPNDPDIYNEFLKWTKAGGQYLPGLEKRRRKEADLYFKTTLV